MKLMDFVPKVASNLSKIVTQNISRLVTLCDIVDNPLYWVHENLHIELHDNQIEILKAVCDLDIKDICIAQARGAGKTYSVAVALLKLCIDYPGLKIGIFGPKAEQACRIIRDITTEIVKPSMTIHKRIVWKDTVKSRLVFDNGSEMLALSADMSAQNEGYHFHIVVLDEAHSIADIAVNQRIGPMLGSLPIGKMIKIGITMYKNHFWKSCMSSAYKVLIKSWVDCTVLLANGGEWYNEKEYSKHVIKRIPLSIKKQLFPDRPDLHFEGEISDIDYKTQYAMEWVTDINLELSEEDQKQLISGTHDILRSGRTTFKEEYFFGLDTAPGSPQPGQKDLDSTVLSIWRKRSDRVKEKVACFEWQGEILNQLDEIKKIIHPITGLFPCKFGLVDRSNIAHVAIAQWQAEKMPVEGIAFGSTEKSSGQNYKNAMHGQFKFELQGGRVLFPSMEKLDTHKSMKNSFNEWCSVEHRIKLSINHEIKAPSGMHDDHCSADILAVWAMDHTDEFSNVTYRTQALPKPLINSVPPIMSRNPNSKPENRYLK